MQLTHRWVLLLAALLVGCGSKEPEPAGEERPGTDFSAFADIDGFVVASLPGNNAAVRILNPRTGVRGGLLDLSGPGGAENTLVSGWVGSPDGRTIATIAGGTELFPRLHVYEIAQTAAGHRLEEKFRADISVWQTSPTRASLDFDKSGRWLFGHNFAVDAQTGEQVGCERPGMVQPLPDGRHIVMECDRGLTEPSTVLYDADGIQVWRDSQRLQGVSPDGQWVLVTSGALHVATRTLVADDTAVANGNFMSPDGRTAAPPSATYGSFCGGPGDVGDDITEVTGELHEWTGPGTGLSSTLPLGGQGAFFDLPGDDYGLTVNPAGFNATGTEFIYFGALTSIKLEEVKNCSCDSDCAPGQFCPGGGESTGCVCVGDTKCVTTHIETRVRRVAVDGSSVRDTVMPKGHFAECRPSRHEATPGVTDELRILHGPDDSIICAHSRVPRARRFASSFAGQEATAELLYAGPSYSPGRRASMADIVFGPDTSSDGTACFQRIDDPSQQACAGSFTFAVDSHEPLFWTGWAADGGGGHAGPVVYRSSHRGAPPGTEVTLSGAGLGTSGSLRIGEFTVPAGDIMSWADTQIVFTMPSDAPARPDFLTIDGGLTAEAANLPTIYASVLGETSLRAPERVIAPRGSVFIEVTGSTNPDALTLEFVEFYDPGGDQLAPNDHTVQRVEGGFVVEIADPQPVGEVAVRIADGVESRIVFLDIDGSMQPIDEQWVTRHHGFSPISQIGLGRIADLGGRLVIPTAAGAFLLHDDGSAQPIDQLDHMSGTWTHGIGNPHVLTEDRAVRRVESWNTTPMVALPEFPLVTRLDMPTVTLLTQANQLLPWAVHQPAGAGMFFSAMTCATCDPDHSISLSSFDATPLTSPDRDPLIDVVSGPRFLAVEALDLTSMQFHLYSGDAANFGASLGVSPPVARGPHAALADAIVVVAEETSRVLVHAGTDAPGSWVDAGIDDAMVVGATSDGAFGLVGTRSGEVFMVDASGVAQSLGSVPGWEAHGADSVSRAQLVGNETLLVWWVEIPNPRLYLRARP